MALNFSKLCILILVGTVAYNEYVVYYMDYFSKLLLNFKSTA